MISFVEIHFSKKFDKFFLERKKNLSVFSPWNKHVTILKFPRAFEKKEKKNSSTFKNIFRKIRSTIIFQIFLLCNWDNFFQTIPISTKFIDHVYLSLRDQRIVPETTKMIIDQRISVIRLLLILVPEEDAWKHNFLNLRDPTRFLYCIPFSWNQWP